MFLWIIPAPAAEHPSPIRIGLASVVLTGEQPVLQRWRRYLQQNIGRIVEFKFLNSCRKVADLLQAGYVDFAWIGGYCFVKTMSLGYLKLMTVPVYRGEPRHRSLIIVHRDSPFKRVSDMRGGVFAFSDPDSNTGFAYPLTLIPRRERKPETYFRQAFFTFSHAKTVRAVAEQVADGGAVDSYVWEYLASQRPGITRKTRIIRSSPSFGFPPIVSRTGAEVETVARIKEVFETMHMNTAGKSILAELKLDEFRQYPSSLFNNTRKMMNLVPTNEAWPATVVIH
ncbi:PhnD/SsuA/transferrin family substrate-binding protein [Gammaproteobacteria bacterium]|nr:PhnD/SsuA/transferrin family substrate-binding protein [Gammaproteobacteria bacterium]